MPSSLSMHAVSMRAPPLHGAQQLKLASEQNQAHIELLPRARFNGLFYVASQAIVFFRNDSQIDRAFVTRCGCDRVLDPQDIPILRLVIATLRYQTTPTLARGQGRTLPLHAIGDIVLRGECGSVGGGHTEKERQAHQRARKSLSHSVRLSGSYQSLATATASIPDTGHRHPSHGHKTGIQEESDNSNTSPRPIAHSRRLALPAACEDINPGWLIRIDTLPSQSLSCRRFRCTLPSIGPSRAFALPLSTGRPSSARTACSQRPFPAGK